MKYWKQMVLFYSGGGAYMTLEFLWRGRSSGSMFLLGGTCFLVLGKLGKLRLPLAAKVLLGPMLVTALELMTGLAVNRDHGIWDYRKMPWNFRGQICLPYSLLWMPLSVFAMVLYKKMDAWIDFSQGTGKIKKR